jgi:hypothetical protein
MLSKERAVPPATIRAFCEIPCKNFDPFAPGLMLRNLPFGLRKQSRCVVPAGLKIKVEDEHDPSRRLASVE